MGEVLFQPLGKRTCAVVGETVLQAAQRAGVAITAGCGGSGTCAECRVRVLRGAVSAPNEQERALLPEGDDGHALRLACQTILQTADEVVVDLPLDSLSAAQRSLVDGEELAISIDPVLPVLARATPGLGFAVDLGTTSVAAYLVDFATGATLVRLGVTNPQVAYGEDVIARLTFVLRDPAGGKQLQAQIVQCLNDLLCDLCAQAGALRCDVLDVVVVGNTAMHHMLLGLPVEQLGTAPYVPSVAAALTLSARKLGLEVAPDAQIYLPPNVAGFVGGDHLAMLLASATVEQPGVTLSLDIGTNTELTLNAYGQLWSCSAASGPAFEGAHIRDGMRAADGAIEHLIWTEGRLEWTTINNASPIGLCGSGILDCVAALGSAGIVSVTGAMRRGDPHVLGTKHTIRYEIVPASQSGHARPIALSRADINEVQLAKAAIRAAIKLLTERAQISEQAIDRVIVAGAFGNYLNLESAISIGMFPLLPRERFRQVGNAAGIGAKRLLLNRHERMRAAALAQRLQYIELTNHPDFADRFSQALLLTPDPWDR